MKIILCRKSERVFNLGINNSGIVVEEPIYEDDLCAKIDFSFLGLGCVMVYYPREHFLYDLDFPFGENADLNMLTGSKIPYIVYNMMNLGFFNELGLSDSKNVQILIHESKRQWTFSEIDNLIKEELCVPVILQNYQSEYQHVDWYGEPLKTMTYTRCAISALVPIEVFIDLNTELFKINKNFFILQKYFKKTGLTKSIEKIKVKGLIKILDEYIYRAQIDEWKLKKPIKLLQY